MEISVIIPTFNEELTIKKTLDALARLVNVSEVVVVDGGSSDKTVEIVESYALNKKLKLVEFGAANRGRQLHEGTKHASGDVFWFLNADARPVQGCGRQIKQYMRYDEIVGGNFDVVFDGKTRWARFATRLYAQLRLTGLVYSESAIFARRTTYEQIKGFRDLPLVEDVDLHKRLSKKGRVVHVNLPVTTSPRRFEKRGFVWTFAGWSIIQSFVWVGVPARLLGKGYKAIRK